MQKNVPKYTPDWVRDRARAGPRRRSATCTYALCNDRRTLLWFAQPARGRVPPDAGDASTVPIAPTHLVLDLDPPEGDDVRAWRSRPRASCARRSTDVGLDGAVKTSGAKGVHVFVPIDDDAPIGGRRPRPRVRSRRAPSALDPDDRDDRVHEGGPRRQGVRRLDARRWRAPSSPRTARGSGPGAPVSFPVAWDELDDVTPADFTVHTALDALGDRDPWAEHDARRRSTLAADLVEEGHAIPVARVQAMHEGKRRKRARGG